VLTDGVEPSLHVEYKHSHVKQYFKGQHALRTETTINNPKDFYVNKGVDNLPHLRDLGHQVNRKLLEVERVSHQCVLTQDALDRLQCPTVEAGQRASALRFGDPRVMALLQALEGFTHVPRGFRNRDLRPQVEDLRSASAASQGVNPSRSGDASIHRDQLRAESSVLLQQALSADPPTRVERLAPRHRPFAQTAACRPRPPRRGNSETASGGRPCGVKNLLHP
jgi:hypothetical protein